MNINELASKYANTHGGDIVPPCTGLTSDALSEVLKPMMVENSDTGVSTRNALSATHPPLHGSVVILGGLSLVNSLHAYTFASLKRKKLISTTPLNDALNALILALNASAAAFVLLFTKKFRILS